MAKQQNNGQEQDVNQLRKVRRDKLAELQQNGKDPFGSNERHIGHDFFCVKRI